MDARSDTCSFLHRAPPPQVYCIAAASIIAKVTRDRIMLALDRRYPAYGWASNQGYGTAAHLAGLAASGPCPHHRTDFAPVRRLLETRAFGTLPDIAPRGCTNR